MRAIITVVWVSFVFVFMRSCTLALVMARVDGSLLFSFCLLLFLSLTVLCNNPNPVPYRSTLHDLIFLLLSLPLISPSWVPNSDHLFRLPSSQIGSIIFPPILNSIHLPFTAIFRISTGGCVELWLGCSHHHLCWPLLVLLGVHPYWRCRLSDLSSHRLPLFLGGVRSHGP